MSKLFITSDYHLGHNNIIKYCNRPFKNVDDMNWTIIKNYNNVVKQDDLCYNLGDVIFTGGTEYGKEKFNYYLRHLNGRHVIIKGNHEKSNKIVDEIQSASMFKCGLKWYLVHDPINSKIEYDVNLVGHVHNAWLISELHEKNKVSLIINCCVDMWKFRPVPFTKLFELYQQWKAGKVKAQVYDKKEVQKFRHEKKSSRVKK
jgi:calcineurin-like phosphoesterase family protein